MKKFTLVLVMLIVLAAVCLLMPTQAQAVESRAGNGDDEFSSGTEIKWTCVGEHTWDDGEVTKKATCKEAGVKTFTCKVCSLTKTEAIPKPTSHTYETVITKATLTTNGCVEKKCSSCGDVESSTVIVHSIWDI